MRALVLGNEQREDLVRKAKSLGSLADRIQRRSQQDVSDKEAEGLISLARTLIDELETTFKSGGVL